MVELLAPAGSPSSVEAAVQGGADAIYLGYGDFNARRNAKNFTKEQLEEAIDYCHVRGVSVFLTLNTLLTQRELLPALSLVDEVATLGIDAVIVQDLGVAQQIKQIAPSVELHASTQLSIHSLDGVKELADFGFSRVVLARELGKSEIRSLAKYSPLPLEVFVHGAQCMSYSGQCYLSAMVGQRSGNRGLCAQPCRLAYRFSQGSQEKHEKPYHPMSLKDMSLIDHVLDLMDMGVASFKLEGRMKRAEYVYVVTKIYSDVIKERRSPTEEERNHLALAFSRQGFTQGYYQETLGRGMFGVREQTQQEPTALFQNARKEYENKERRKVICSADLAIDTDLSLTLEDERGNQVQQRVSAVEQAKHKALTPEIAMGQLQRTGGTAYEIIGRNIEIAENKAVPLSILNQMRRELLEELSLLRVEERKHCTYPPSLQEEKGRSSEKETTDYTVWVQNEEQITENLLNCQPTLLYVPVTLSERCVRLCEEKAIPLCVQVPSMLTEQERESLIPQLERVQKLGVTQALVGTVDTLRFARNLGFSLRGDYGLGMMNHQSLELWKETTNFLSATVSFELKFPQMRDLRKEIPLEFFAYGNLPLMITKNCMIRTFTERKKTSLCEKKCASQMILLDRKGEEFPVEPLYGGRNMVNNGQTLYLADKKEDWSYLGMWAARLRFTRESPETCVTVLQAYQQGAACQLKSFTRGLYYRGVN